MRRLFYILLLLVILALPVKAAVAPVEHTAEFYINDYASILTELHRADMLALSRELYDATGVQLVVLTVDTLGGLTMRDYGGAVIRGWGIGGPSGGQAILLLIDKETREARILVGKNLASISVDESRSGKIPFRNPSEEVMALYKPLVLQAYEVSGATPGAAALEQLETRNDPDNDVLTVLFFAAMLLIMGRSYRNSRKYRQKYLKGHVRKLRTFTRSYPQDDGETVYRIEHDDMD